jgi:hypothetical protein
MVPGTRARSRRSGVTVTALALTHPAPVIMRNRALVVPCLPRHLAGCPHCVQLASPCRYFYRFRSPLTTIDLATNMRVVYPRLSRPPQHAGCQSPRHSAPAPLRCSPATWCHDTTRMPHTAGRCRGHLAGCGPRPASGHDRSPWRAQRGGRPWPTRAPWVRRSSVVSSSTARRSGGTWRSSAGAPQGTATAGGSWSSPEKRVRPRPSSPSAIRRLHTGMAATASPISEADTEDGVLWRVHRPCVGGAVLGAVGADHMQGVQARRSS